MLFSEIIKLAIACLPLNSVFMLREEVVEFLKGLDISVLSLNDIISKVNENFNEDYTTQKEDIEKVLADLNFPQDQSDNEQHADLEFAKKLQEQERRQSRRKYARKENIIKPAAVGTKSNPFNRPVDISESLQEVVGIESGTRPQVVKLIWKYIKENNLQDPSDRRYVICDDKLHKVFKRKRLNCFKMNCELSNHLYSIVDFRVRQKVMPDNEQNKDRKMVCLPSRWVDLGLKSEITYHQLQLEIVHCLREHRSPEDPDIILRPSTEHILSELIPQEKDSCTTAEIFRNLRTMFKSQLED